MMEPVKRVISDSSNPIAGSIKYDKSNCQQSLND